MASLSERDQNYLWHPYTHHFCEPLPVPLKRAEGIWLITEDGKYILDAISSWWVNLHGHGNKRIADAIAKQAHNLEHAIFSGFTHQPAVDLAERLLSILPINQKKIFFSDNGSTAVEVAMKMAVQYSKNRNEDRSLFIALESAYHGDTFGSMSISRGKQNFSAPFDRYLFSIKTISNPDNEDSYKCLEEIIKKDKPLAFIFEPLIQGAGGMKMHSAVALSRLIELCKKNGVLTIADEVMTGFGRTGDLFASLKLSHSPDIICLSKGITGGFLPLGATSCTEDIYQSFNNADRTDFFLHGHSYSGNPLACAAGVASFDILNTDKTKIAIQTISQLNHQALDRLQNHRRLKNARSIGTILAVDIKTNTADHYSNPLRDKLYNYFLSNGVLMRPLGNTVYIMPPYCISDKEHMKCVDLICSAADSLS